MADQPRPLIGLAAGIAAGLIAAAALAAAAEAAREADREDSGEEPETLPTPAAAAPEPRGNRTRFIAGAVLGGIYGLIAEFRPEAREGFGDTYRIATSALISEEAPAGDDDPAPTLFAPIFDGIRTLIARGR